MSTESEGCGLVHSSTLCTVMDGVVYPNNSRAFDFHSLLHKHELCVITKLVAIDDSIDMYR